MHDPPNLNVLRKTIEATTFWESAEYKKEEDEREKAKKKKTKEKKSSLRSSANGASIKWIVEMQSDKNSTTRAQILA